MEKIEKLYVINRNEWRTWLEKNHNTKKGVWLIYYKKHTGKPRIPYAAAVEEALCFGWIDSIVKRLDDEKYVQKFTPRSSKSKWSESNIKRVKKMMREGMMTEAGLAKCPETLKSAAEKSKPKPQKKEMVITSDIRRALAANKKVWDNFNNLAPSYKRQYIGWITSAKKQETRNRRLKEAITLLKQNKKLGLK